jgi:hypothetical protein
LTAFAHHVFVLKQHGHTMFEFFPKGVAPAPDIFRSGARGTHSSRTMMLAEISNLVDANGLGRAREAVVESNALNKDSVSGRMLTFQRLRELYSFDEQNRLFRVFHDLVNYDTGSLSLLALLVSLARDPLLRASAPPVLGLAKDSQLMRDAMSTAISTATKSRLNEAVLDKVVRNAASSWTQAGHLVGRTIKRRHPVSPTPAALAFALWLGTQAGFHGEDLFRSGWVQALDLDLARAKALAERAHVARLIVFRPLANAFELDVSPLDRLATR